MLTASEKKKEAPGNKPQFPEEKAPQNYYPLRFRSTGLGKTILEGFPDDLKVVDDMLVVQIRSVRPVQWQIRAAISFKGLIGIIKMGLRPPVLKFLLRGITTLKRPRLSDEF